MSTRKDDVSVSTSGDTRDALTRRPFHIVFAADLATDGRLAGLQNVDKDSFADLMRTARPTIRMAIPAPVGGGPDWEFALSFDSPRSLEPAGFLAQLPTASWRLKLREAALQRRTGKLDDAALQKTIDAAATADPTLAWVRSAGPPAPPAQGTAAPPSGGSVLDLVDDPDESARVRAEIERLARSAGQSAAHLPAGEIDRLSTLVGRLNVELTSIATAILGHDAFRAVERTWRSLKLLVDRIDFPENNRLDVVDAPLDQVADKLIDAVFSPAFDGEIPTPGLVVLDFALQNAPPDLELLEQIGQHAAGLPVPVVFPLDAAFLGVKNLRLVKNLPHLPGLVDGWQFAKWRTLRDQPWSRALAPVLGRFLLRAPYAGAATADTFEPLEQSSAIGDLLWAGGHLALAISAARSYAAHGWPTRMFGDQAGKLENLPVVPNPNEPGGVWGPGDLVLPDRRLDELPQIGVNFLMCVPNSDHCILLGGVTAARPVKTADTTSQQAALAISLPYAQFNNIVGAFLCESQPALKGLAAADLQRKLLEMLRDLLNLGEDEQEYVAVGVGEHPDQPGQTIVQVRIVPPPRIAPGGLAVDFGFSA